jgi:hypothetical protein
MTEVFVKALENHLGVAHTKISLAEEWSKSGPEELRDKSLSEIFDVRGYFRR